MFSTGLREAEVGGARPPTSVPVIVIAVLALSTAVAKEPWIIARTPHLSIVSNARESATRTVAQRLERFTDAFSSLVHVQVAQEVPVTVMVFKDDVSFAPFRPRQRGKTMNLTGYFQRADDENLIALSLQTTADDDQYRVIFHEYAHALTVRSAVLWPLWLQEGLAEFSSTFQSDSLRASMGQPIREHVRRLRNERMLPLQTLFRVDRDSPMYTEDQQNIFYAEAWALVHYLLAGDDGRHRGSLTRFIDGISAGRPAARAFAEAFGADDTTLEEDLGRYIGQGRYIGVNVAVERSAPVATASVRPLAEAEADVFQGSLLMRVGRGDAAEPYFARARALNPGVARLEESLGFLALARAHYEEALAHLTQAIAQNPANHLAHYYYAETLRRQVMEQGHALSPDVARAMAEPLRAVITLMPSFARAHYLLGYVHLVTGEDLAEGVRLLETAIRLAPPNRAAMLTLANIQLKMRDYLAARSTAQAILDAPDSSMAIKADARLVAETATQFLNNREKTPSSLSGIE